MKRGRSGIPVSGHVQKSMVDNSHAVIEKIARIYKDAYLSDISLIVGRREYPVHRLMLSASSGVFDAMFSPRWLPREVTHVELKETAACEKVFGDFLRYLYTGKIQIFVQNVLPVLQLADKYDVEELVTECIRFMERHIPRALTSNVFISWLQYSEAAGFQDLSIYCKDFTLWNISLLGNCADLDELEPAMMKQILKETDLVVESEFVLFKLVLKWLTLCNRSMLRDGKDLQTCLQKEEKLIKDVMKYVRFPMMEPNEIEELHVLPIVSRYKDFFMWRLGVGMSYQCGQQEQADRLVRMITGSQVNLMFTPRLYTANMFSLQCEIENISDVPQFVSRTYCFSSRTSLAYHGCSKEESMTDWSIDIYPRGVFFDKFFVIVWQGLLECPEQKKRTVRMRLTCHGPSFPHRVKVGVCILRTTDNVEHIASLTHSNLTFECANDTRNFDDIIGYDELTLAMVHNETDSLKINLIIMPLDKHCTTTVAERSSSPNDVWRIRQRRIIPADLQLQHDEIQTSREEARARWEGYQRYIV